MVRTLLLINPFPRVGPFGVSLEKRFRVSVLASTAVHLCIWMLPTRGVRFSVPGRSECFRKLSPKSAASGCQISANEHEYNVWRINMQDVVVRYVADSHSIMMTAKGDLAPHVAKSLALDLALKMTTLENAQVDGKLLA
ncbi:MAG TPA: hypothetical protein VFE51_08510 [Verrucomicrobiae bacterium]|nr:hypothetical protein [Verrucomicrobiae bacterium]